MKLLLRHTFKLKLVKFDTSDKKKVSPGTKVTLCTDMYGHVLSSKTLNTFVLN